MRLNELEISTALYNASEYDSLKNSLKHNVNLHKQNFRSFPVGTLFDEACTNPGRQNFVQWR
jgi:hypothetical protein